MRVAGLTDKWVMKYNINVLSTPCTSSYIIFPICNDLLYEQLYPVPRPAPSSLRCSNDTKLVQTAKLKLLFLNLLILIFSN